MKKRPGFTLMEMLISMTIVGILAAIVSPGLIKQYQNRQCVAFMQQVQSGIHYAASQRGQYNAIRLVVRGTSASNLALVINGYDTASNYNIAGNKIELENVPIDHGDYIYQGTFEVFTRFGATTSSALGGPASNKFIIDIRAYPGSTLDSDTSNTYFAVPIAGAAARTGTLAEYDVVRFSYTSVAGDVFSIDIDTSTGATTTNGF